MRASGASELRTFWHLYILKVLFLSIFCWYFRYFVSTNDMLVGLHVPTNFQMYRQNSEKALLGGLLPPPPPPPPLATLVKEETRHWWLRMETSTPSCCWTFQKTSAFHTKEELMETTFGCQTTTFAHIQLLQLNTFLKHMGRCWHHDPLAP